MRARIGFAPEHHELPSELAASDFVRHLAEMHLLPRSAAVQRANDALWLVGLGEERFRPVGTMSTGQRQRVKLASAIAHDPELVLLDEPTDGLDPIQRTSMLDLIRRIGTEFGLHIVISSHHLEEVERICDAVVIVEGGEVVRAGTLADVRRGPEGLVVEVDERAEELARALAARASRGPSRTGASPRPRRRVSRRRARRGRRARARAAAAGAARADARGRVHGGRSVSSGPGGARLFDLGYRGYDGERHRPARAIATLALFTGKRVLGLGRGGRHKVLPAITLVIAYLPALVSVLVRGDPGRPGRGGPDHVRRLHVLHRRALALFAALIAPEALCPDRRSGMLGLYLAGPLDRTRYLVAKVIGVYAVMLLIAVGPLLFMLLSFVLSGYGPRLRRIPGLLLRILASGVATALLYTSLSLAVSSFTTRRAAAAVGTILLLYVPLTSRARRSRAPTRRPSSTSLSFPFVASELSYRIFGEIHGTSTFVGSRRPSSPEACSQRARSRSSSAGCATGGSRRSDERREPRVVAEGVSKWFGPLVAVSDVSFEVGPGVTALLGPNGAGKSTMFRMLCGLARPSKGTVRVLGRDPRADISVHALDRARPAAGDRLRAAHREAVRRAGGRLHGLPSPSARPTRALEIVGLDPSDSRLLPAYSKGMRQRAKVAQAIVHDPSVLVLDEPLTGLDPRQRGELVALFRRLGGEGRCVIVSSHVLAEVERLGSRVLVMSQGRLAAMGDFRELRALMDDRPLRVRVRTDRPRELAGALLERGPVVGLQLEGDDSLELDTSDARALAHLLAPVARETGARLLEVRQLDADLEGVFRYVVER